jgi:hypothetical protein
VHIVGLGFDPDDAALAAGLARHARRPRSARKEMADSLAQVGIHGAYEGALKYVGNPELISRTHFARFLVETGVCRDTSEVFRRFLTEGKPGFVPHRWARLGDAVRWITGAGGVAVIAHPARYKFTPTRSTRCSPSSRPTAAAGSRWSPAATAPPRPSTPTRRASSGWRLARQRLPQPRESRTDLGTLPDLPAAHAGVGRCWPERIHVRHDRLRRPRRAPGSGSC